MDQHAKVYIAGHRGLVGSAILRKMTRDSDTDIICRTSQELDLCNQSDVMKFFAAKEPEYVFLAAAKVGGILENQTYPANFIYENIMIQSNIIHAAYKYKVKKLLFLGSSCIYPKLAPQPIKEEYLLTGELEPTNAAYAVAKITGIQMCQAYNRQYETKFISVMPTNLYGPNDNFDLASSHVLPALIRKFHEAKIYDFPSVEIWGTGRPRREFLHVDDLADACLFLMETYEDHQPVNIGVGKDISIQELAALVRDVVGYSGKIIYNSSMPDGTPRKLLDVAKITNLGWQPKIKLEDGIANTYQWYLNSLANSKI